jgi:hypothetical protein
MALDVERALSRSWVLLVNRAWRSLPACRYFNALGPSWSSQIGSKSPILGECDNAHLRYSARPWVEVKEKKHRFEVAGTVTPGRARF